MFHGGTRGRSRGHQGNRGDRRGHREGPLHGRAPASPIVGIIVPSPPEFESKRLVLEPAANLTATNTPDLVEVRVELDAAKSQLDNMPPAQYQDLSTSFDPYLSLKRRISATVGKGVTNAWLKIVELTAEMRVIPTAESRVHFEAEFPGAMIKGLLYVCPELNWIAGSLVEGAATGDGIALGDVYGMYADHRDRWLQGPRPNALPEGWPDVDGDLTVPPTVNTLARAVRDRWNGGATHYIADGGFDVSGDYNRQEELTFPLNKGQITCGLLSLAKGGCLITKMYTFFTEENHTLLAYLTTLFDELWITKPRTSRRLNSEIYLVGKGFHGLSEDDQVALSLGEIPLRAAITDNDVFRADIYQMARRLAQLQTEALEQLVSARNYRVKISDLRRELAPAFEEMQDDWLKRYLPRLAP